MGLRWWGWLGEVMCGGAAVAVVWWWGGGYDGDDNDAMVMMMMVVASVWWQGVAFCQSFYNINGQQCTVDDMRYIQKCPGVGVLGGGRSAMRGYIQHYH
ncbi:hypothetical protein Tco_1146031 [Tanacetum coccineum]